MIKLFVGLGNPGAQYELSRHNAGFWWVDNLAGQWHVDLRFERNFQADVGKTQQQGKNISLLKPMTFMNLSGDAVASFCRYYKISPDEVLVVHDELDLPAGSVKLKFGGGHAGHNGLRDLHRKLGSSDYWRLRLGIGHPGTRGNTIGWVLGKPSAHELAAIEQAMLRSLETAALMSAGQMEDATKIIHTGNPPSGTRAQDTGMHQDNN